MANLQAGDRVLITFRSLLFNQNILSTFVYGCASLTGTPTQNNAFDRLHAAVTAGAGLKDRYLACCAPELDLTEIWYQIISPSRYAKYTRTSGLGVGTLGGGEYKSANAAAVILRRGDLGVRSNVSTLHMPIGQTSDEQAGGGLGFAVETALNALAVQMVAPIATTTIVSVWDPVINNGPNAPDFTPIVATTVKPTVRVMRRRTVGYGI